jgi:CheY-like chemotaxis protein
MSPTDKNETALRTILVIEDQSELRGLVTATLEQAGYHVVTATTGRDANKAFAEAKIDLVLTDLLMPDRDGIEVIRDLRGSRPDLPIVAMSGGGRMPAAFYLKLARSLGAKAILEKPFSNQQLLLTIALALPEAGHSGKAR